MHYDSGSYFPVVIEIRAVDCGIEQMQSTMASIEHATDQCATFVVKALKQKLVNVWFKFCPTDNLYNPVEHDVETLAYLLTNDKCSNEHQIVYFLQPI